MHKSNTVVEYYEYRICYHGSPVLCVFLDLFPVPAPVYQGAAPSRYLGRMCQDHVTVPSSPDASSQGTPLAVWHHDKVRKRVTTSPGATVVDRECEDSWIVGSQYSGPSLKGHSLEKTPPRKDTNSWHHVPWMHVMLPLTKGHLSNKVRIFLAEGVSLLERDSCIAKCCL